VAQALVRVAPPLENSDAKQFCDEQMAAFITAGDRRGEAAMKIALSELCLDLRVDHAEREAALEAVKDAKAVFIDLGDKELEARATMAISMVLIKKCDRAAGPKCAREALKYARETAAMAQELEDKRMEAKANFLLFSAKMYGESPWKDGVKYAKEAVSLYKQVGARWWAAVVSKTVADWALMKGNGRDGLPYAQDALDIFREIEPCDARKGWEASCLNTLIGAIADEGEEGMEKAMEVAKAGAERLKAGGDKLSSAQAYDCLASAHCHSRDFSEAIIAAEESLKLYRELGDKHAELSILSEISRMQMEAKDTKEALGSYQDAFELAKESGDIRHQGRNMSAIVRAHLSQQEPDKALEAAAEALALYQKIDDKEGEGVVLLNMASAHMLKEAWDVAGQACEEARLIFLDLDMKDRQAQALFFLAEVGTRSERFELALASAVAAKALYQKLNEKVEEANMLYVIAQSGMAMADKVGLSQQKDTQRRARRILAGVLKAGKEGLAIARKLPERDRKEILSGLLFIVGQALGVLGKYKDALKIASEGMRLATDKMDRTGECGMIILLAQIHNWNGKPDEARSSARRGLEMAQKIQDEHLENMAAEVLYQLEPKAGAAAQQQQASTFQESAGPADSAVAGPAGELGPYSGPTIEFLIPKINELAMTLLSTDELHQDTPLMDSGLDSLSMVQFRNTLQQQFPGVPMPASLIFDHPSVRAVSENIVEELQAAHSAGRPIM